MRYALYLTRAAEKDLRALPKEVLLRVDQALRKLQENPFPPGVRKLRGFGPPSVYRLRVGDYRLLYTVEPETRTITVARIKPRKDAYR